MVRVAQTKSGAGWTNAIVLICDANFLPPAYFICKQLLDQQQRNFDVVILAENMPAASCRPPDDRIIVREFAVDPRLVDFAAAQGRSHVTYGRLSLDQLRRDYHKVLYLDSDVWIAGSKISDIFSADMGRYAIAAVRDSGEILRGTSPAWLKYKAKLGMAAAAPYLNAGVLLIDLERFAQRGIGEDAKRYVLDGKYLGGLDDQSALNAVLRGDWLELSPRWNWTFPTRDALTRELSPHIIHFVGSSKPWNDVRGRYPSRYRLEMGQYLQSIEHSGFVKPAAFWPQRRRQLANALRGFAAGLIEDPRTIAIRQFAKSTGFSEAAAEADGAVAGLAEAASRRQGRAAAR